MDCCTCMLRPAYSMGRSLTGVFVVPFFSSNCDSSISHKKCLPAPISISTSINHGRLPLYPSISIKIRSQKKSFSPSATLITSSEIASNAFTAGTAAVLPFYTLMVVAPHAKLTKRIMESSIPYIVLGILYAYVVDLCWTPDSLQLMFSGKYWAPELPGIMKMFSDEMTTAAVWLHLVLVDLFAARQIFHDGLRNKIETRHSVSMCLLSSPIGIIMHAITKTLSKKENLKKEDLKKENIII